jgi:hypothetical protein
MQGPLCFTANKDACDTWCYDTGTCYGDVTCMAASA